MTLVIIIVGLASGYTIRPKLVGMAVRIGELLLKEQRITAAQLGMSQ